MSNRRRESTKKKLGLDDQNELDKRERALERAKRRREEEEAIRKRVEGNTMYAILIKGAPVFDVADGLLGIFEIAGDVVSSILGFLYVFLSATVVRSVRLTIAVFGVALIDALIGFIPVAGSALDFVFCGNTINRYLIQGYVDKNPLAMRILNIVVFTPLVVLALIVAWIFFR